MAKVKEMEARKIVSMPADMAEAIAEFRAQHRIGSEAEALRQLLLAGLAAHGLELQPKKK